MLTRLHSSSMAFLILIAAVTGTLAQDPNFHTLLSGSPTWMATET